jgi:hypothetical protein
LREKEQVGMGPNGMRIGINETRSIWKIPLTAAHETDTEINDTIPNNHEWYLPFMIGHYHSCQLVYMFRLCQGNVFVLIFCFGTTVSCSLGRQYGPVLSLSFLDAYESFQRLRLVC